MRFAVACFALAGCGFKPGHASAIGDGPSSIDDANDSGVGSDGPMGAFLALHVPPASSTTGTAGITITTNLTIDSDALTIGGAAPPSGVTFDHVSQVPSGPELAVLHVSTFTIATAVTARVIGTRPLVVIASDTIAIDGVLDAGALLHQSGAGGGLPASGDRPGVQGAHDQTYCDAGGGGGGQATAGGTGGGATGTGNVSGETCNATGGVAGGVVGDNAITVLAGGSGGGPGRGGASGNVDACVASGGAGGGAVQLSSATAVAIAGEVSVGGGGGRGGVGTDNTNCTNRGSGGGGGSAGSIVLQAPSIIVSAGAYVVAHGGGGGGGATVGTDGLDGGDGATAAGAAGLGAASYGSDGGAGGSGTAPSDGATNTVGDGNGGGAGGAAGRIAIYRPSSGTTMLLGTLSPSQFAGTY
jgi:hypothetical protein